MLDYALLSLSAYRRADGDNHHRSQHYHCSPSKFCPLARALEMRKTNYSFEKRQREIAKQKKKDAKRLKKSEKDSKNDQEENA